MHSAIVVVEFPSDGTQQPQQRWQAFLAAIVPLLQKNSALVQLGENVWQVNFQQSPAAFAELISACGKLGLRYGILPLYDEPQWLPDGFDPGTIWRP
jgi:hypothetical protein